MYALVAVSIAIAIFCMFAAAFDEDEGNVRGSVFHVMFSSTTDNYNVVWPLVIGFGALCLAFILAFIGMFAEGKIVKALNIVEILLIGGGTTLFLFIIKFYEAANNVSINLTGTTELGAGTICVAVFGYIALVLSALTFPMIKNED